MMDHDQDMKINGTPKTYTQFEDILKDVGGYGRYQKRMILFFLIPTSLILPFFAMNLIFLLSIPDHWCRQSTFDHHNFSLQEQHILLRPLVQQEGRMSPSKCEIYNYTELFSNGSVFDFEHLKNVSRKLAVQKCDDGWDYDKSLYSATVPTKWDLFCEKDHLPTLVFTMSSVGSAVGTPIYGAVSDKIGRKPVFILTVIIGVITNGLTVLVPTFLLFTIVRTIVGSTMPCAYQLPYLILLEMIAPEMRARVNGISCVAWTVGLALMPLIAYLSADWITFGWVCFAMMLPYLCYYWYLPESARWLISQAKYEDAAKILANIAEKNEVHLPDGHILMAVKKMAEHDAKSSGMQEENASPISLIKYPRLRKRFLIICISWMANSVSYYAFHINVSNLSGNEFMNFFYLAIVEFPSYIIAWFVVQSRLGRRWCNVIFTLIMAVACFTPAIAPSDMPEVAVAASIIGKFGNCASFLAMYQQASELFPTAVRASGMGIASTVSSIISIFAPYIIYLGEYGRYIPFLMIACVALLSGICCSFLPETLNENLPQTIHDGEEFASHAKYFSLARTDRHIKKEEDEKHVFTEMGKMESISSSI